jgi:two-component system, response regulator PdtaR
MSNLSMLVALGLMRESEPPLALVVDDNELLRLYAGGLLADHGFEVVEGDSAEAALKVMQTHDGVRLLFIDIRCPVAMDWTWRARSMRVGRTSFW